MARGRGVNFDITAKDRTRRAFDSVQGNLSRTSRSLGAVKAALTAAFVTVGLAAVTRFTQKTIEQADAIAKTADALGVSTDALQEYRYAAQLAGVEQEKFDSSLTAFVKRLGEFQTGRGQLATFLKEWDEGFANALEATTDVEQALGLLFEEMAQTEDATKRAALAAAAFSRQGVAMVNLVRDGADGLEEMRAEAVRLGLVLEESLLRGAENAADALARIEAILSVNFQRLVLTLAPTIVSLGDAFAEAAPKIREFIEQFIPLENLPSDSLARQADNLREELGSLQDQLERFRAEAGGDTYATDLLQQEIDRKTAELLAVEQALLDADRREAARAEMFKPSSTPANDNDDSGSKKTFDDVLDVIRRENEALGDQMAQLRLTAGEWARMKAVRDALRLAEKEGIEITEERLEQIVAEAEQTGQLAEALERLREKQKEANEEIEDGTDQAEEFGRELFDAFRNAASSGGELDAVLQQLAMSLAQMLWRASGVENVLSDALGSIFGLVGGVPGGGAAGGSSGGTSAVHNARGNAFSRGSVVPFARGGIVGGPQIFPMANGGVGLMGEAGPEGILPLRRGANGRLGVEVNGGGGGPVINVTNNITVQGGANGTPEETAARIGEEVERRVRSIVTDEVRNQSRPGGALRPHWSVAS